MNCEGCREYNDLTRRGFLGLAGGAGAASLLGLISPTLLFAKSGPKATSKHVIILWMNGGQSHIDTWDPKPKTDTGGPFEPIKTAVRGIQISEHLPRLAKQFKDISLIRSLTSKEGSHQRAQYLLQTGYLPVGSFQHSTLGSTIWKMMGKVNPDLPAYVNIGNRAWPAGHLGSQFAGYHIPDPKRATDNVDYHRGITLKRFDRRLKLLRGLDRDFADQHEKDEIIAAYANHYQSAYEMMHSKSVRAFDLSQEPAAMRDSYGTTFFGQGCLLARRLIQTGVRVVQVTLSGWDTHQENFERVAELSQTLDQAVSALITDLRRRDLLDRTLLVLCGEFGRTPKINDNLGRDHWPRVWSAMIAGGGISGGRVIGKTTDGGEEVAEDPVQVGELHATICKCMDIDPMAKNFTSDGRPIRVVKNVMHYPIDGLFG